MNQAEYDRLEREFIGIRDERGVHANTAVRIGTAFLDLLRMTLNGEFDEIVFNKVLNKPTFLQGLIALGSIILGEYAEGLQGGIITEEGVAELKDLWVREHAKLGDGTKHYDEAGRVIPALEVKGDSTFTGNLSSPEFVSAFFGGLGWAIQKKEFINAAGEVEYKYHLEIDNITVRNTLRVFEMIISQLLGENANRFFSDMMEVDHYEKETGKVWLKTGGGKLYNSLRAGDIVIVQQYNGDPTMENDWYVTKAYEFRVKAVGIGDTSLGEDRLDWLTFENFTSTMLGLTPENAFKEGDTFVRADNDVNPNRKGLVTIMAVGENTPYMDILYGMKTDPKHALKGRIGSLEGIRTDIFGWLEGFGAYINNIYAVGKFFNAQTGEGLSSRVEILKERFRSFYKETVYNIPDDQNFISNGFFQNGLVDWSVVNIDGSAPSIQEDQRVVGSDSLPLLFNGQLIGNRSKLTAEVTERDGIQMLHLRGMGVAQGFNKLKPNGTHLELVNATSADMTTRNVADTLYMGVRILPMTSGRLSAWFVKQNGTRSGWQMDIEDSLDWQLYQCQDLAESPWAYDGSGSLIIGYTGECYIRFVALQTDPVVNTREQYSTLIEQTARRITLEASRLSGDLTDAVAEIELEFDHVRTTVTNNKTAADAAFSTLNNTTIPGLSSRITTAQNSADSAQNKADSAYNYGYSSATWIDQNKNRIALIASQFDSQGNLTNTSGLVTTSSFSGLFSQAMSSNGVITTASISTYTSSFVDANDVSYIVSHASISANQIHLEGYTTINSGFSVDAYGNVVMNDCTVNGTFNGGKITESVRVGSDTHKMYIRPRGSNGAELVGYSDNTEVLNMGFTSFGGYVQPSLNMYGSWAGNSRRTNLGPGYINAMEGSSRVARLRADVNPGLEIVYGSSYIIIETRSDGKTYIYSSSYSTWPSSKSSVPVGGVYRDGDNFLKVRDS